MTKATKLKICDWILAVLLPVVLASGIQLEVTSSSGFIAVMLHVIITVPFMCLIIRHIYLHFQWKKWLLKFSKLNIHTRILWWLYVLTFLSGLAAVIHWALDNEHSPLGGIHGKIGLLMIAFAIAHVAKRYKFYKRKPKTRQ